MLDHFKYVLRNIEVDVLVILMPLSMYHTGSEKERDSPTIRIGDNVGGFILSKTTM